MRQGSCCFDGCFFGYVCCAHVTALTFLTTGALSSGETGSKLAQVAFSSVFGHFGDIFVALCMFFFAFSTIVGWYFFRPNQYQIFVWRKSREIVFRYRLDLHHGWFHAKGRSCLGIERFIQWFDGDPEPVGPLGAQWAGFQAV